MAKKIANNLRKGDILVEQNGLLYEVVTAEHSMTGKRTACVQVYMKGVKQGNQEAPGSLRVRYMPDAMIEVVDLIEDECNFLYMDGDCAVVMASPDRQCEQFNIPVGKEVVPWLTDGIVLTVLFNGDNPVHFSMPKYVNCTVVSTEMSSRHHRVTSSYKPAELDNGAKVQVPPFIKDGDRIVIKTEDFSYEGKAKDEKDN